MVLYVLFRLVARAHGVEIGRAAFPPPLPTSSPLDTDSRREAKSPLLTSPLVLLQGLGRTSSCRPRQVRRRMGLVRRALPSLYFRHTHVVR